MIKLQQDQRRLQIVTSKPFLDNSLLVQINGSESFSEVFHYECVLFSTQLNLTTKDILASNFIAKIMTGELDKLELARYINGIITSVTFADLEFYDMGDEKVQVRKYTVHVRPVLYLLQYSKHNRVFQSKEQTSVDIVQKVLKLYGIEADCSQLSNKTKKEYCLQFQESDYEFVLRILSEIGAYFYFKQTEKECSLIIADKISAYNTDSKVELSYFSDTELDEQVRSCCFSADYLVAQYQTSDFLLDKPSQIIQSDLEITSNASKITASQPLVYFDYQEALVNTEQAKKILLSLVEQQEVELETLTMNITQAVSVGDIIQLSGTYFKQQSLDEVVTTKCQFLTRDMRGLVQHVDHQETPITESTIEVIKQNTLWRPKKQKSTINPGIQLAHVVNAKGNTDTSQPMYFDELGRVCVKFVWEGYTGSGMEVNKYDQCMVSMLHHWDNGLYRVGTTVLVDFINNDPDKPVIIGAVNTGDSLPLGKYTQENANQSIISRIPGKQAGEYNAIKFDDKNDNQVLTITAINELVSTSKKETYTTENHSRSVKNNYQLDAEKEEYTSKGTSRKIDGNYELQASKEQYQSDSVERKVSGKYDLSASDVHIKGSIILDGNLIVKGTVDVQ